MLSLKLLPENIANYREGLDPSVAELLGKKHGVTCCLVKLDSG